MATKRQVFFSFHYDNDSWRASQIRNMGVVESDAVFSDNGWESVRRNSDSAIERWISEQMAMRSCVVVLVGSETASRKWVKYEIEQAWQKGKGLLFIDVHNLKDYDKTQSSQGADPSTLFYVDKQLNWIREGSTPLDDNEIQLSSICPMKDPGFMTSTYVYDEIKKNIVSWIEEAICVRNRYPMP